MAIEMSGEDWREIEGVLKESAARSASVRRALERFAAWLTSTLETAPAELGAALGDLLAPPAAPPAGPSLGSPAARIEPPTLPPIDVRAAAAHLQRAWTTMPTPLASAPAPTRPPPQPAELAPRARLKADACRWAVRRSELELGTSSDALSTRASNDALRRRAQELGGLQLWMLSREVDLPGAADVHMLAAAFDNLGHALEIAEELEHDEWSERETQESVLTLVAEAQSALRVLLNTHHLPVDPEQDGSFEWLCDRTDTLRVYLPRFMRLDAPADPTRWEDLGARIASLQERLTAARARRRDERELRSKLAYHCKRILNSADHAHELAIDDWRRVFGIVERLLALGIKPSDVRLRDELLPLVELRPVDLDAPAAWESVVEEIDRALARRELDEPARPARERTPAMIAVADWLRGKRVVMIGGVQRPGSRAALVEAFELGELVWISSREHESIERFRADIAHSDTVLVLRLIRWTSHSFAGLKTMADVNGKHFVNLPRGYNPAQVAEEILRQALPPR